MSAVEPEAARRIGAVIVEFRGETDVGRAHPLFYGRNVLGRDELQSTVTIDDPRASKRHASIFVDPAGARFLDDSTNGSRVDGVEVRTASVPLAAGSRIEIGGTTIVFLPVPWPFGS
jgi:pSer/pThr/pTyr-binding forkhead associated (FHA) protein